MVIESMFFFFITVFLSDHGLCLHEDDCKESRCGNRGPSIRFPFRIKGHQKEQCGFPDAGFDLSCSDKKTVLELPNSVKLFVKHIDYKSQIISTIDPQGCFPRLLSNFSLSSSPFRFSDVDPTPRVLFNCSGRRNLYPRITCLSSPNYEVYRFYTRTSIDDPDLLFCTKMYDVSPFLDDLAHGNNVLHLSWFNLSCGSRAANNQFCRLKSNTPLNHATECYGNLRTFNWKAPKFLAPAIILSLLVLAVTVLAVYRKQRMKLRRENDRLTLIQRKEAYIRSHQRAFSLISKRSTSSFGP